MKINPRDTKLLTIGFVIGTITTVSLVTIAPPPPPANNPRAFTIAATGPVIKAASLRLPFIIQTNIQWQTRPIERHSPPRQFDSTYPENPLHEPRGRKMDLITTRYQPDIKLDDVK